MSQDTQSDTQNQTRTVIPHYRQRQTDTGIDLQIALPGVEKSEVTLTAKAGALVINAPRPTENLNYQLNLKVGNSLDSTAVTAAYDTGLLKLSIPVKASLKARSIEVR